MRRNLLHHGIGIFAIVSVSAFVLIMSAVFPAFADIYMLQKKHDSQKIGKKEAKVSESIIRTWVAEGRFRQDYGDPAGFIHIVRLDRRPGELISYLINPGTGPSGNTYWTFCRPRVPVSPPNVSDDQENETPANKETKPVSPDGSQGAITVTDTGETKLINNFRCKKFLLKENLISTELSSEIWVTMDILPVLKQFGLVWGVRIDRSDSDLNLREDSSGVADEMRTIKGFPVLITEIEQNEHVYYERKLELLELKEAPLPSNHFDLPGGLTKKYRGAMAHPPVCED
jgi:hypothetical protein